MRFPTSRSVAVSAVLAIAVLGGCSQGTRRRASGESATVSAVRRIVADQQGVSLDKVAPRTTLRELGAHELDVVEIVMKLEDRFQVTIGP